MTSRVATAIALALIAIGLSFDAEAVPTRSKKLQGGVQATPFVPPACSGFDFSQACNSVYLPMTGGGRW